LITAYKSTAPVGFVLGGLFVILYVLLNRVIFGGLFSGFVGFFVDTTAILNQLMLFSFISGIIWVGGLFCCVAILYKLFGMIVFPKELFNLVGGATLIASLIMAISIIVALFSPIASLLFSSISFLASYIILYRGIQQPEIQKVSGGFYVSPFWAYMAIMIVFNVLHTAISFNLAMSGMDNIDLLGMFF